MFKFAQLLKFSAVLLTVTGILLFGACSKETTTTVVPTAQPSNPITNTTITKGSIKGTMLSGTSYTIQGAITVNKGDTLLVQNGVNVTAQDSFTVFYINGTLIVEGTSDKTVTFDSKSGTPGTWGGFQCDSAQSISIKWAHINNTGGPDASGSARRTLVVSAPIPVTIEDSWFKDGQDDCVGLFGGCKISVLRNTLEHCGRADGEGINIKTGATGVVAYNVVWSQAGHGIKLETSKTVLFPQTNVKVYNNTLVGEGFRRGAGEPGAGVFFDVYATGECYNNLIVSSYYGLQITKKADTATLKYGNNYLFTAVDSTRQYFFGSGDWGKKQTTDVVSTSKTDKDPLFVNVDGTVTTAAKNTFDFHLKTGSPALGIGNTTYNKDIGAYPSDGTGNKH